jgi:ribulose 1,5-bisphosphate synthetase/thiazole synthase
MKTYDLVIAGAGPSGCIAALAAARMGLNVLLIEKYGFAGGMNTAALVSPLMTFHAGEEQIIKGIPQEIIDDLIAMGGCRGHLEDPLGVASTITPVEPELLRLLYARKLTEAKVDLLFHTYISGVVMEEGIIKGLICVNKSGTKIYEGRYFIDATGDADVAAFAKLEFFEGREKDGLAQPMTMLFKMGGVNISKIKETMAANAEQFILNKTITDIENMPYLAVSGFFDTVETARQKGDFNISRDRVLFFEGVRPGDVIINMTRILNLKGTNAHDLVLAEIEGQKQVLEVKNFLVKYIAGFENSYITAIGAQIGVRESRRIKGNYTVTKEDILEGRVFDDSIARGAFPIDIHDPSGNDLTWVVHDRNSSYDIPYRAMLNRISNLLVAGRCISATHEAIASIRISATAMALGHAAGAAAAVAAQDGIAFSGLDIRRLQRELYNQNASVSKIWPRS